MDMARKKTMVTMTLDPDLVQRLKDWIAKQPFPPAQNQVVEKAVQEFLDKSDG